MAPLRHIRHVKFFNSCGMSWHWPNGKNVLLSVICGFLVAGAKPDRPQGGGKRADGHDTPVDEVVASIRDLRESLFRTNEQLQGKIRKGSLSIGFHIALKSPYVEILFSEPADRFRLPVDESVSMQEFRDGRWIASQLVLTSAIADTLISYEDIAFRFLFWPHPTKIGTGLVRTKHCSIVRFTPPANQSAYTYVEVWFEENSTAPLLAICYGPDGRALKRFDAVKFHRIGEDWVLQSIRVSSLNEEPGSSSEQTYIEFVPIDRVKP